MTSRLDTFSMLTSVKKKRRDMISARRYYLRVVGLIVLIFICVIPLVTAELQYNQMDDGKILFSNGSFWIKWDPIGNHIVGDPLVLSGTTNLSGGTIIYFETFSPAGACHQKVCDGKLGGTRGEIQIKSTDHSDINSFSTIINTTGWESNYYYIWFILKSSKVPEENTAFINSDSFMIYPEIFLFSDEIIPEIKLYSLTQRDITGNRYWISFPKLVNLTQSCNQIIGFTNLPPGQRVSYSRFIPIDTGQNTTVNPIRIEIKNQIYSGIVVMGNHPGINKIVVQINSSDINSGSNIIVWNPRYNTSDRSDSISASTKIFNPKLENSNISLICPLQTIEINSSNSTYVQFTKTTTSPLPWIYTICSILVVMVYVLMKKRSVLSD
jgi:hypothetical protein